MSKILIMTIGLPQSGKSTWSNLQRLPMVNPDSIRLAIHGTPYRYESEGLVWAHVQIMVRSLFLAGHDKVILDATNISRKRRDVWQSKDWVREFVEFTTPKQTCIERAYKTAKDEAHLEGLIGAIERMAEERDPPLTEEFSPEEYDHFLAGELKSAVSFEDRAKEDILMSDSGDYVYWPLASQGYLTAANLRTLAGMIDRKQLTVEQPVEEQS